MKSLATIFIAIIACVTASAQQLVITITNVKNNDGKVGAALYSTAKDFMKKEIQAKSVTSEEGKVRIVFDEVPAGTYAISVMHDANNNQKMDTKALGIPKEGYGFSNDAIGDFGPPTFEKAKFVMTSKQRAITIKMKYFL